MERDVEYCIFTYNYVAHVRFTIRHPHSTSHFCDLHAEVWRPKNEECSMKFNDFAPCHASCANTRMCMIIGGHWAALNLQFVMSLQAQPWNYRILQGSIRDENNVFAHATPHFYIFLKWQGPIGSGPISWRQLHTLNHSDNSYTLSCVPIRVHVWA